jgi:hypothetical protein
MRVLRSGHDGTISMAGTCVHSLLAGAGLLGSSFTRVVQGQGTAGILPLSVYVATEYAFDGPAQLNAGLNRIIMRNDGAMDHHAMFLRLNDGKTYDDLAAAAPNGLEAIFSVVASVGGPGSVGPDHVSTAIMDLAAGDYLVVCVIPDEDGVPHMAKGMMLPVQVVEGAATPEADAAEAVAPVAELTVEMGDFVFSGIPETVPTGSKIWEVTNVGAQLHELAIFQLGVGVDQAQVEAILGVSGGAAASPMAGMEHEATPDAVGTPRPAGAPFTAVAGWAPASPGTSGWIQFDAAKGTYVAVCFVPDAETGAPHYMLGMIQFFTVE